MQQTELKCPVCKNDSYLNPGIKIFISPCFHKLCQQCLNKMFSVGYAPCPECGTQLRKINFISSTFEDVLIEREIKIRKMLRKHYKLQDEPEDIERYNDWLEDLENFVEELCQLKNERDVMSRIKSVFEDDYNPLNIYKNISIVVNDKNPENPAKKLKMDEKAPFGTMEIIDNEFICKKEYKIPKKLFALNKDGDLDASYILQYSLFVKNKLFQ